MTWVDDGAKFKLYVSTSGDFVSLGTRTPYPFQAGGSGGVPLNWTYRSDTGSPASDVNLTTQDGRFSVSNASASVTNNGKSYGAYRDFTVVPGTRYVVNVQVRTMDNKSAAVAIVQFWNNGVLGGQINAQKPDSSWEQLSIPYVAGTGITSLRVELRANPYWAVTADARTDWGIQWQNVVLTEVPASEAALTWQEVTCDSFTFTARHGRSRFTNRYDVATCQISVRNQRGDYSYQPVHPWNLRPGRFVRVVGIVPGGSTELPMFFGIIDSLSDGYTVDGYAVSNLSCIDTSSLLANITVPTAESDGTTSISTSRFTTLTRAVAWAGSRVSVAGGSYMQQPILNNGRSVRDELGLIADSEGGHFFADRLGTLTYRGRSFAPNIWTQVQAELLAECADPQPPVKLVFPGRNGNGMTVPDEPGFSLGSGTIVITALVTMDNLDTAGYQTFISQTSAWYFRKTGGARTLQAKFVTQQTSTAPLPYNNGDTFWVRVMRSSNGTLAFYHAPYTGSDEWGSTTFVLLGDLLSDPGTVPEATTVVAIGGYGTTSLTQSLLGRMHRLALQALGTIPLDIWPRAWAVQPGATTVPLTSGQVATVVQTDPSVLVQADPDTPPNQLVPVDGWPTRMDAAVVMLQALATDWSRDRVVNDVQLANQGGGAFQFVDDASQKKYGPRTYQRLDLLNDNAHPEYLIERSQDLMDGFTEAMLRVNSVDFRPNVDTYEWSMRAFLNDLVRVRYEHPTEFWGWAVVTHIQSVQHTVTTKDWQVQLVLDNPESFNRWNAGGVGNRWDEGAWDEAVWDEGETAAWSRGGQWSNDFIWGG